MTHTFLKTTTVAKNVAEYAATLQLILTDIMVIPLFVTKVN